MRHLKHGRKLGRVRNQRKALFKTMLGSLILKERIKTTEAKAKELKNKIDRIINKAKKYKEAECRVTVARQLSGELSAPAVKKLTSGFIDKLSGRNSGYVRIIKLVPRQNDGAKMAIIEFVE